MFSTFTGNARRPRNVNLSGAAGNPFSNTSWSPSVASNPTKAVTNAQADREKRHADRQRLKAAGQIQRTWRGHKERTQTSDARRAAFDRLYDSHSGSEHAPSDRLHFAFNLLLAFFSPYRYDDVARLVAFTSDCESIRVEDIPPTKAHPSRMMRFAQILTQGTQAAADRNAKDDGQERTHVLSLIKLASRVVLAFPQTLERCAQSYFAALAAAFASWDLAEGHVAALFDALSTPFKASSDTGTFSQVSLSCESLTLEDLETQCYEAFAFQLLVQPRLDMFESSIGDCGEFIDLHILSNVILDGPSDRHAITTEQQLWQLAHFIALGRSMGRARQDAGFISTLQVLLADLSAEISMRLAKTPESSSNSPTLIAADQDTLAMDSYPGQQLLSLVSNDGLSQLIQDLSAEALDRSNQTSDSGILPAYISTLLLCFPNQADEIRMRLFLSTIPTSEGDMPIFKYIWHDFQSSSIFNRLATSYDQAVVAMRQYFHGTFGRTVESEWRVAVMFLELYIFVLRLSDDDDFFSAMKAPLLDNGRQPSRLQACSLALSDLETLTAFLKNTAFAMHYKTREISEPLSDRERQSLSSPNGQLRYPPAKESRTRKGVSAVSQKPSARLDYGSVKDLVTVAVKMLYERDSRKQFLPTDHWLMADSLEMEDFINAVITEELRRRQEEDEGSDAESDVESEGDDIGRGRGAMRTRAQRLKRNHKEMQKQRRLAEMGPKLEILKHMPFVVPFETRVRIFRHFIAMDQSHRGQGLDSMLSFAMGSMRGRHHAKIRRGYAFDDAYKELYQLGEGLKDPIQITFKDQWGVDEAGIDGGGVTKEFLTQVTNEAFAQKDSEPSMFTSSYSGLLFPDPKAADIVRDRLRQRGFSEQDQEWRAEMANFIKRYEFLGRIIGKCMYEGILIDITFAGFFLLQWSSAATDGAYKGSINDLRDIDEELYKGMLRLKDYPGDVSELDINFTINDQVSLPGEPLKTVTRNLIPNGDNILVTNDNRLLYISYVARHRLVAQSALQTGAFLRGLREMIRPSWLSMFNQIELQRLVGGDSSEIDIDDLRRNTVYSGLYAIGDDNEEHPTIKLFWKVMRKFTDQQRRDVIKYVSSTPRAPLLGFSQLTPKFSIRDSGSDESRLPSTSTCVNLLKLPRYTTEEVLREKLLYAVTSGAGFDLS